MKKRIIYLALIFILTMVLSLTGYIFIIYAGEYVIDNKKLVMNSATKLVNQDGEVITKLFLENRELVTISEIPDHVEQAFISVEDTRFYKHHGIDVRAILRALSRDIMARSKVEGGSTITQQLAKNIFLTDEKTLLRKTKELIIAINLEKKYSKQELLEMYLNRIYFGHGAYGVQAASKLYFNKDVTELTVEEGALLAAIPKAPSNYSPILHPEKSKQRRDLVISLMEEKGYMTAEEAVRFQGKTLKLNVQQLSKDPYLMTYVDMVFEEASEKYSLSNEELLRGGYTITVPMDKELQRIAFELFQNEEYFPGTDENAEGAFVLLDNKSGGVLAAIGGRSYVQKGLNRVNVKRQPGSTIKPLAVYGPAMEEKALEPYSLLVDKRLSYGEYEPKNYNDIYKNEITMYDAIVESANAPAVWTLDQMGVETGKKYLSKSGISIPDKGLSIALGGLKEGISPLDMTIAYRAFAAEGKMIQPHTIYKIVDRQGKIVGEADKSETDVFSKQTAWYMTRMLEGVVEEGTATAGKYSGALAGKTGTTNVSFNEKAIKDAWFVGFTPSVVGAIWMGYDSTDENHYLKNGSSYPTKLFKDILEKAVTEKEMTFKAPSDVTELESPIRLTEVNDLEADFSFKPFRFFTVKLKWTPSQDERVQYRVYEKRADSVKLIETVTGVGFLELGNVNIFSAPTYYVVPYNPQTKREGKQSNTVQPQLF
ncbi:PBP1A family penicillin-binding protein [Bacillus timonensis]|nr:PBP1A family penicillin-binding protein [Bacillus timonensis]